MARKIVGETLRQANNLLISRQENAAESLVAVERKDAASISLTDPQLREVELRLAKPDQRFVSLEEARKRLSVRRA